VSDGRRRGLARLRWLPALGVMAVIFVLSSQSGLRVSADAEVDGPLRTLAHFSVYALLAAALLYAVSGPRRPSAMSATIAVAVAMLFGVSDEIHQAFVPDRTGQLQDVLVDGMGAVVGALVALALLRSATSRAGQPLPWSRRRG